MIGRVLIGVVGLRVGDCGVPGARIPLTEWPEFVLVRYGMISRVDGKF